MSYRALIAAVVFCGSLAGQTIGWNQIRDPHLISGTLGAIPACTSTTRGWTYNATDQLPGANTYVCLAGGWSLQGGAGAVSGPGSSTNGFLPQWNGTLGNALSAGLPVSTTPGANTVVEAGGAGTIAAGWLPSPGVSTFGGVKSLACGSGLFLNAIGTDGLPVCGTPPGGGNVIGPTPPTIVGYVPYWADVAGVHLTAGLHVAQQGNHVIPGAANSLVETDATGYISHSLVPATATNEPNDGATGTVSGLLAKIVNNRAITATTSDTNIQVWIASEGAGTTGFVTLATTGFESCTFDAGGSTHGNYVVASSSIAGRCHDAGSTFPTSGWVIGTSLLDTGANGSGVVILSQGSPGNAGGGGGNVSGPGAVTSGFAALWTGTSNTLGVGLNVSATPGANTIIESNGSGKLAAGWIPNPSASTLGGTESIDCTSGGQFVQTISTSGVPTCATPAGGGNVSGPGSSTDNFVPQWNGASGTLLRTGLAASALGPIFGSSASMLVKTTVTGYIDPSFIPATISALTNDGTTPAATTHLAKVNSGGNASAILTTDTAIPVFITSNVAGGVANVFVSGAGVCVFDAGGAVIGHYVVASGTVASACHDAGATYPGSGWIIGQTTSAAAAGATAIVQLLQGVPSATSSLSWSALSNPSANLALTMAANTSTFTYNSATGSGDLFSLTDTASNTGTGRLFRASSASGSSLIPWQADANGVGWKVTATGALESVGIPDRGIILHDQSGSGAVTVTGPATIFSSWTFTLPVSAGVSGNLLVNNGTGSSGWGAANLASAATVTGLLGLTNGGTGRNMSNLSGAGLVLLTSTGVLTTGNCPVINAGNLVDSGAPCGGSSVWSALTNPTGNLNLSMGANTSTFTFNAATGSGDLFKLTDGTGNTGTGFLLHSTTGAGSGVVPFQADVNGVGWRVQQDGSLAFLTGAVGTAQIHMSGKTSGSVNLSVQDVAGAYTFRLPNSPGTNTWPLITDGSGQTSFAQLPLATGVTGALPLANLALGAVNTVLMGTGVTAPAYVALPTGGTNGCAGTTDAVGFNTTTHAFVCNTISGGGSTAFSALTGPTPNTTAAMVVSTGASLSIAGTSTFNLAGAAGNTGKIQLTADFSLTPSGEAAGMYESMIFPTSPGRGTNNYYGIRVDIADPSGSSAAFKVTQTGNSDSFYAGNQGAGSGAMASTSYATDINYSTAGFNAVAAHSGSLPCSQWISAASCELTNNPNLITRGGIFYDWSFSASKELAFEVANVTGGVNPVARFANFGDNPARIRFFGGHTSQQELGINFDRYDTLGSGNGSPLWFMGTLANATVTSTQFAIRDSANSRIVAQSSPGAASTWDTPNGLTMGGVAWPSYSGRVSATAPVAANGCGMSTGNSASANAAALSACISAHSSGATGLIIYFPAGNFPLGPINILQNYVVLEGAGNLGYFGNNQVATFGALTRLICDGTCSTNTMIKVGNNSSTPTFGFGLSHIVLDGANLAATTLWLAEAPESSLEDAALYNATGSSVVLITGNNASYCGSGFLRWDKVQISSGSSLTTSGMILGDSSHNEAACSAQFGAMRINYGGNPGSHGLLMGTVVGVGGTSADSNHWDVLAIGPVGTGKTMSSISCSSGTCTLSISGHGLTASDGIHIAGTGNPLTDGDFFAVYSGNPNQLTTTITACASGCAFSGSATVYGVGTQILDAYSTTIDAVPGMPGYLNIDTGHNTVPWLGNAIHGYSTSDGFTAQFNLAIKNQPGMWVESTSGDLWGARVINGSTGSGVAAYTLSLNSSTSDTLLHIKNTTAGGIDWAFDSTGTGSGLGTNRLYLMDATNSQSAMTFVSTGASAPSVSIPAIALQTTHAVCINASGVLSACTSAVSGSGTCTCP